MISKTLTVVNPSGLHLRPAGVLSQTAMKFKSDITIECGEKKIVAKSVLNVMAAGIKCGTEITLICDGEDEQAAMDTLSQAIESGLGEMYFFFRCKRSRSTGWVGGSFLVSACCAACLFTVFPLPYSPYPLRPF